MHPDPIPSQENPAWSGSRVTPGRRDFARPEHIPMRTELYVYSDVMRRVLAFGPLVFKKYVPSCIIF